MGPRTAQVTDFHRSEHGPVALTFIANLWEHLDRPCSQQALDKALSYAQTHARAFDPALAVLVYGDAHNGYTLQDLSQTPSSFKLMDPDGLVAKVSL